ncbi:MAG: fibronectin type III domain-containing protein [Candidatus Methanospirareceae archaeon]
MNIDKGDFIALLYEFGSEILTTGDHGLEWTDLGVITADGDEAEVLVSLGHGIAVLADHHCGSHVYRTTDYGATWTDLGEIMTLSATSGAYISNGIALLADESGRIFRSTDYGATWTDLGDQGIAFYLLLNLGDGIVIAGNNAGRIFRSTDYGATWTDLGVISTGNIYAGAYFGGGIAIIGDSAKHIFRSTDYGATWTDLGVITAGGIEDAVYLGNGIALVCCVDGHLWRSSNDGAAWTDLGEILSSYGSSFTNLESGSVIVTDGGGHIFRSIDYGHSWSDLGVIASSPIFDSAFLGHGTVVIGDNHGHILRSTGFSFKGIYVPLQSAKQLLDVKLAPGDAVVYTDPAENLVLDELLTFKDKSFTLVSNSKIQYINGNPIYMELGLERFMPSITVSCEYDIRTLTALLVGSSYDIAEELFSLVVPASYNIPIPESGTLLISSEYDISEELFSLSVPASYDLLAPTAISGLRVEFIAPDAVVLHWNALDPADADYFEIYRSTTTDFIPASSNFVAIAQTNSFRNRDLDTDTTYYFKVRAVDPDGNAGAFSSQVSATTSGTST